MAIPLISSLLEGTSVLSPFWVRPGGVFIPSPEGRGGGCPEGRRLPVSLRVTVLQLSLGKEVR